jgi:hypothetical protein
MSAPTTHDRLPSITSADQLVAMLSRMQHTGDDGWTPRDDNDDAENVLDEIIAKARILRSTTRSGGEGALARRMYADSCADRPWSSAGGATQSRFLGYARTAINALATTPSPDASPDSGCTASPDHADILETIENAADDWQRQGYTSALAEVRDMANVGRALMEVLPKGYNYMNCPSEIVTDLMNERDEALAADASPNSGETGHRNIHGEPIPDVPLTPYADPEPSPAIVKEAGE